MLNRSLDTALEETPSGSCTPPTSLSPRTHNVELVSSSFSYHHESLNSTSQLTTDKTTTFKKSLLHRWTHKDSILCVAASPKRKLLYCGTQNSTIIVLDLVTFQKKLELQTHTGSVLCLKLSECEDTLFSGGSDSLVKIWKIEDVIDKDSSIAISNAEFTTNLVPTHTIYSLLDVGDIFSISWIEELKTVFIGAQNASLSFIHIDPDITSSPNDHIQFMPSNRFDKFFDSNGTKIKKNSSILTPSLPSSTSADLLTDKVQVIQIPVNNIISYAHNGYLYALDYITIADPLTSTIGGNMAEDYKHIIISAGGDGEIRLWGYSSQKSLVHLKSLEDAQADSIYSLAIHKPTLTVYAGSSDGNIHVWDLTTFQLIKTIQIDNSGDVYTLAVLSNDNNSPEWLLVGTDSGIVKKQLTNSLDNLDLEIGTNNSTIIQITKDDPCLTLQTFKINNESYLVGAGSDKTISLWPLHDINDTCSVNTLKNNDGGFEHHKKYSRKDKNFFTTENFLAILGELISFKSVSKQPDLYMGECRKCANYLTVLFKSLGATKTQLLPVENGGNPVVHAIFKANSQKIKNGFEPTRLLWYGHYDVIPASSTTWDTPPFAMTPSDGYLYARGVTDNKGPLLVSIFAIAELYSKNELDSDVVFVIEGEEESGSWGFQNVIFNNIMEICDFKKIDWILLSNSYWLDNNNPSLNYGLRGKLEIQVEIWSDRPDRHSGVDGGVYVEPSMDLIKILSKLDNNGKIMIAGFEKIYENDERLNQDGDIAHHLEEWERPFYKEISSRIPDININELLRKWRLPSLTLHKIEMSGPDNDTVISQKAEAKLSIRIIPGQELDDVKQAFNEYVNQCFNELNSTNHLNIKIMHEAEPWLGNINSSGFKVVSECVEEEWGIKPILVREGGSIPAIRFLEKAFQSSAIHIPTGQSSDNAHLNNERVRIVNLLKSREIIKKAAKKLVKEDL